jgi:hypothetical protein
MISGCHAQQTQSQFTEQFELVTIRIGTAIQQVQLADTSAKRRQGLMGQIPLQHGMLLLHPSPNQMVLWMKNTPSALDVAFFDANWTIVGMTQMQPYSEDLHESPGPVLGALEMPLGWFAKANIAVGQQLTLCKVQCEPATNSKLD